jgi:thioesterase domain-containing protein
MATQQQARSQRHWPLVPIRPMGTKKPLFIVPGTLIVPDYELTDAQFFIHTRLIGALGSDRPVYGLRTLGLGGRMEGYPTLEQMAAEYATIMQSVQPRGPYLIAGFCVGGVVAYELARQLAAAEAVSLILFDTSFPSEKHHRLLSDIIQDEHEQRRRSAKNRLRKLLNIFVINGWKLHRTVGELASGLSSHLRYRRSSQNRAYERFQNEKEHLYKLVCGYRPGPYRSKLVLVATDDLVKDGLERGWDTVAAGGLEFHYVPGTHGAYARDDLEKSVRIINGA